MPANNHSVGRDVTLDITDPNGPVRFATITSFDAKPITAKNTIKAITGIIYHQAFPDGWSGTISIERQNNSADAYFAQREADYYAGRNLPPARIMETIRESDGSLSRYRYEGVVLIMDDAGNKQADKSISMKMSWMAARRIKV